MNNNLRIMLFVAILIFIIQNVYAYECIAPNFISHSISMQNCYNLRNNSIMSIKEIKYYNEQKDDNKLDLNTINEYKICKDLIDISA